MTTPLTSPHFLHSVFYKKLVMAYNDFLLLKCNRVVMSKLITLVRCTPVNVFPSYNATIKAVAVYAGVANATQYLRDYIHIWVSIQLMISGLPKNNPLHTHIRVLSKSPNLYPILRESCIL